VRGNAFPRVVKAKDGAFVLRNVPPAMAIVLRQLPELLSDGSPGIRERLTGSPYPGDDEGSEQWEKYAVPELEHLFRSARDLVVEDVAGLGPESRSADRFQVSIPAKHLAAWISSLAAVRVALGGVHRLTEQEMESELPPVLVTARDRAVLVVHLLGWVQGLLVEAGA